VAAQTAKPLVIFPPASKVHLQIQGTSIMHHITSQHNYNTSATYRPLRHISNIAIAGHSKNSNPLASSINLKLFAIKWVNHMYPLGSRQHRINAHHSPNCPSYNHPLQGNNHMLHCPHSSCQALLKNTLNILYWTQNTWTQFLMNYHDLFTQQKCIGWDHLFYGHLTSNWISLQHCYLASVN
jgi:hypothetical protein